MKTILVSAYAVNPYKGSEDGTGWHLVCQIARFHKAVVITRENNRPFIERYMSEEAVLSGDNLQFQYYDLPYWMRFWKRGARGALLYFYLWQLLLPLFVMRRNIKFDIAHHLNFHNDFTPTFLWVFRKPLVWGPIGHHEKVPFEFIKKYGAMAWLQDRSAWLLKIILRNLDPLLWLALYKADRILAVNSSEKRVHSSFKDKIDVMPAVAAESAPVSSRNSNGFKVLSVGRFVPLKGFDVSIKAFAKFYKAQLLENRKDIKLILVGKGPEKERLQMIACEEGINHAIQWIDWVDRAQMQTLYQQAHVFLFPSHEGAGMVIPEALSYGLPVLCFNNFGPGELSSDDCAFRVSYGSYEESIAKFAEGLQNLYSKPDLLQKMSQAAYQKWSADLNWDVKGEMLNDIYKSLTQAMASPFEASNTPDDPNLDLEYAMVDADF